MAAKKPLVRPRPMVGWFNPGQLMKTAAEVAISTVLARHIDNRRIDTLGSPQHGWNDYSDREGRDLWIDYVADCGDGWKSTYAVAEALARPSVDGPRARSGRPSRLPRAEILLFGGDLVYPTPSREEYDDRLVGPYATAAYEHGMTLPSGANPQLPPDAPHTYAIPGNHDWYDSLGSFHRLFFNQSPFAAWQTKQRRSYFALRLPKPWWLFAVDVQLHHDIDVVQRNYFQEIVDKELGEESRVILCAAEPFWVHRTRTTGSDQGRTKPLLEELEQDVLGSRLSVMIAGDLHHYRRHSTADGRHAITCGTGGAFLHPTHDLIPEELPGGYVHQISYPTCRESHWLTYRNLLFPLRNKAFGILTAIGYLLMAWANGIYVGETFEHVEIAEIGEKGLTEFGDAVLAATHSAVLSPIGTALYLLVFFGFWFFTDRTSRMFRFLGGTLHAVTHVVAGFLIYWFSAYYAITVQGLDPKSIEQYLTTGFMIFALAWVVGSFVMGLYLTISMNRFKKHSNEAFSALRIEDWKGFLRMRFAADGSLSMYFVGLRKMPRRFLFWRRKGSPPHIEDFVHLPAETS